jgi:hypothetical protein
VRSAYTRAGKAAKQAFSEALRDEETESQA